MWSNRAWQSWIITVLFNLENKSFSDSIYHPLPSNISSLDNTLCRSFNRAGRLCGRCLPNHYPLAYSFNLTCITCQNIKWNWVRYISAAYLLLTAFYLFVFFSEINVLRVTSYGTIKRSPYHLHPVCCFSICE